MRRSHWGEGREGTININVTVKKCLTEILKRKPGFFLIYRIYVLAKIEHLYFISFKNDLKCSSAHDSEDCGVIGRHGIM